MNSLIENLNELAQQEGYNRTGLDGVGVFKASKTSSRAPMCYGQGIIIVAQGSKRVYLDQQAYDYNPDNYLVLALPLPAECETVVEPGKPLLALLIDINMSQLNELVRLFDEHCQGNCRGKQDENKGIFVSECNEALSCVVERLAQCLRTPLQAAILGKGLLREILFHILKGPQAAPLFSLVSHNTHLARLERALKYLHENYAESLDVDQLAGIANMSPSTFHRNFRQVTASSPIQYVKKLRLNRARELLMDKGIKVKQAAAKVGYESPTQFSREFKRYFGQSPQEISLNIGL
ncbi:MAG: AraC family transcriptional regulator [Pseudomonadales bacterium]|nr:AraC family transcriptional regulator [Pseudomonadales bacterium]